MRPTRLTMKAFGSYAGKTAVDFDKLTGGLCQWSVNGVELLRTSPVLSIWHATIDNDRQLRDEWLHFGFDHMAQRLDTFSHRRTATGGITVRVQTKLYPRPPSSAFTLNGHWFIATTYTYTIARDGTLDIDIDAQFKTLRPDVKLPDMLPRIGLAFEIPGGLRESMWFGRGPGESYPDSFQSQLVGLHRSAVADLETSYTRPQENGNRHDVRRVAFFNRKLAGFVAVANPLMDFSAHFYTDEALDKANHPHELVRSPDITVHLDAAVNGLGSNSCGPLPLDAYRLHPGKHHFAFTLKAIPTGMLSEQALFRA